VQELKQLLCLAAPFDRGESEVRCYDADCPVLTADIHIQRTAFFSARITDIDAPGAQYRVST
jgi:hypothetical protein